MGTKTLFSLTSWGTQQISVSAWEVSDAVLDLDRSSASRVSAGRVFQRADVAGGHLNLLPCPWPCWEPEEDFEIAACHRTIVFNLSHNCPLKSSTEDFPDKAITVERTKGK